MLEKKYFQESTPKIPNANVRARPDVTFWAVGYHLELGGGGGMMF